MSFPSSMKFSSRSTKAKSDPHGTRIVVEELMQLLGNFLVLFIAGELDSCTGVYGVVSHPAPSTSHKDLILISSTDFPYADTLLLLVWHRFLILLLSRWLLAFLWEALEFVGC
ncbi:unnamed protein product [Ilex paraguariensis]|uniref:Uncharacterized protein n=1 Tax=Ilex paraguariensis TaxID=185542 RepID=A0ABC8S799_9AQUA